MCSGRCIHINLQALRRAPARKDAADLPQVSTLFHLSRAAQPQAKALGVRSLFVQSVGEALPPSLVDGRAHVSVIPSGIWSDTNCRLCSAGGVQFLVDEEHVVIPSRLNMWPASYLSSCAEINFLILLARSVFSIKVPTGSCVNRLYVGGKTSWYGTRRGSSEG